MDIAFKLTEPIHRSPHPTPELYLSLLSLINNSCFPKLLSGNTVAFILSSSGIIDNLKGKKKNNPISHIEAESIKFYKVKQKL